MKLSEKATFAEDLGLDSLDAVEVVMAVEEVRLANSDLLGRRTQRASRSSLLTFQMRRRMRSKQCSKVITLPCLVGLPSDQRRVLAAIDYIAKTPEG